MTEQPDWKEKCGNLNIELLQREAEIKRLREKEKVAERVCVKQIGELGRLRDATQWQPIETAPKDTTLILGFWSYIYPHDNHPTTGFDLIEVEPDGSIENSEGKRTNGLYTHWMPLPEPPKENDDE